MLKHISRTTLDVNEVAEYLGISSHTIYGMVRKNEIPNIKLGGRGSRILFRIESINSWLDKKEVENLKY